NTTSTNAGDFTMKPLWSSLGTLLFSPRLSRDARPRDRFRCQNRVTQTPRHTNHVVRVPWWGELLSRRELEESTEFHAEHVLVPPFARQSTPVAHIQVGASRVRRAELRGAEADAHTELRVDDVVARSAHRRQSVRVEFLPAQHAPANGFHHRR